MLPIIPSDVDWSFILVAFVWTGQHTRCCWWCVMCGCPSSSNVLPLLSSNYYSWQSDTDCAVFSSATMPLSTGQHFQRCCCWLMFLILLLVRCELLDIPILPSWVWRASYSAVALVASVGGCALVSGALILKGDGICCIKCWKAMAVWCSQGSTWTRE